MSSEKNSNHIGADGHSVSKSSCRAPSGPHDQIFITLYYSSICRAPSLTRGRVCLLYMLLALGSAVFLGSESLGTALDLRLPFSSPPTTSRVTVEVFETASTRVSELFSYSLFIRNEPHRKRRLQQFVCYCVHSFISGTCLSSRCLASN
jgi:hypothetical protein